MTTEPAATDRVRTEWLARVEAEYRSAAITQHLTLWLIQLGAPPDLIADGLAIVTDELEHARLSHVTFVAAGGDGAPQLDRSTLGLARSDRPLTADALSCAVAVFCLGETVAVPLFSHLRAECTAAPAREALDRILRDEVRHRDFGWALLDYLLMADSGNRRAQVAAELPGMLTELERSYGDTRDSATGHAVVSDGERCWGLASPRDYAAILRRTVTRDYVPRFGEAGIDIADLVPPSLAS